MAIEELLPTKEELYERMLYIIQHSCNVEYYLKHISPDYPDIERPHDLEGPGNKFEWDVIKGLAVQNRKGIDFDTYVKPSIEAHRKQHHHQMWNGDEPSPEATEYDLLLGAIDSVCALREPRPYHNGRLAWGDITTEARKNKGKKADYMLAIIPRMIEIEPPNLKSIKSLQHIPKIGLDQHIYKKIIERKEKAIEMLKGHGYNLNGEKYGVL